MYMKIGAHEGGRKGVVFLMGAREARPDERYPVCAAGAGKVRFNIESILSWCSATRGCSCVRS